ADVARASPLTTLFPYTTLFRSPSRKHERPAGGYLVRPRYSSGREPCWPIHRVRNSSCASPSPESGSHNPSAGRGAGAVGSLGQRDRKSTRLNSSHVKISYAVFC